MAAPIRDRGIFVMIFVLRCCFDGLGCEVRESSERRQVRAVPVPHGRVGGMRGPRVLVAASQVLFSQHS